MTTIYFVRHAESDDRMKDRELVTDYLHDKNVGLVLSSPYKRAIDTVKPFADQEGLPIHIIEDFRERKVGHDWIEDFQGFSEREWADFNFKFKDGESLREVQERTIGALNDLLSGHQNKVLAVGIHGTALSTIINYYDSTYGFSDFERMKRLMPWMVKCIFENKVCERIETIDLFHNQIETRWSNTKE